METLLKNPKFWVAVVGVIAMVVAASVPGFKIDGEQAAAQIVIMVVYLYGVIKDPGGLGWAGLFASRKFWAALIGEVAIWLGAFGIVLPFGLSWDMVIEVVTAVVSTLILAFAHIRIDNPPAGVRGVYR